MVENEGDVLGDVSGDGDSGGLIVVMIDVVMLDMKDGRLNWSVLTYEVNVMSNIACRSVKFIIT
jgi:hypothetical protein